MLWFHYFSLKTLKIYKFYNINFDEEMTVKKYSTSTIHIDDNTNYYYNQNIKD